MAYFRRFVPLLAAYILIAGATQYAYFADTVGYVQNILHFDHNPASGASDFWDFGHLLLRPSGWLLYRAFGGFFPYAKSGEDNLTVTALLIGLSMVSGLVTLFLLRSLAGRLVQSEWTADFIAIGFFCFHAFLNYLQTGTSYLPSTMWLTLSLWSILRTVESEKHSLRYALLAGAGAALAVLFWFPDAVAFPGLVAAAIWWRRESNDKARINERLRVVAIALVFAGVVLFAAYLLPVLQLHLYSWGALKGWALSSSHGWAQNRRAFRMLVGMRDRSCGWVMKACY